MTDISRGSIALRAFMDGEEGGDVTREGVREVLNECRRLRAILAAMSKDGLGDGALVDVRVAIDRELGGIRWNIVVCSASLSEEALAGAVAGAVNEMLNGTSGAMTLTGVDAVER